MSDTLLQGVAIRYRPKTFADVVGQDATVDVIARAIDEGKPFRQVLLIGPAGVGKTTLARIIGASLTRDDEKSDQSGRQWARRHPLGEYAASKFVDSKTTRRLIGHFGYKEVIIIDDIDNLPKHAFNELLVPLEQPPRDLIFILCAQDITRIPDQILSRCHKFDLSPVNVEQLVPFLRRVANEEGATISDAKLKAIAENSGGFVRDALNALEVEIV